MERNEAIERIKKALKKRSGKSWSVTGGTGTAWGWIQIDTMPKRKTAHSQLKAGAVTNYPEDYETVDTGVAGGYMTKGEREELAKLLGMESVGMQGESIPASDDYRHEYVDRAEGKKPSKIGKPYWD